LLVISRKNIWKNEFETLIVETRWANAPAIIALYKSYEVYEKGEYISERGIKKNKFSNRIEKNEKKRGGGGPPTIH